MAYWEEFSKKHPTAEVVGFVSFVYSISWELLTDWYQVVWTRTRERAEPTKCRRNGGCWNEWWCSEWLDGSWGPTSARWWRHEPRVKNSIGTMQNGECLETTVTAFKGASRHSSPKDTARKWTMESKNEFTSRQSYDLTDLSFDWQSQSPTYAHEFWYPSHSHAQKRNSPINQSTVEKSK